MSLTMLVKTLLGCSFSSFIGVASWPGGIGSVVCTGHIMHDHTMFVCVAEFFVQCCWSRVMIWVGLCMNVELMLSSQYPIDSKALSGASC